MFLRMTFGTLPFGVQTRLGSQQSRYVGMTFPALVLQGGRIGNRRQRLMRIGMTAQAALDLGSRAVRSVMTDVTLGHEFGIIALCRVIGMEYLMTIRTEYGLMPGALVFYSVEMGRMATGAILNGQRLYILFIKVFTSPNRCKRTGRYPKCQHKEADCPH